MSTDDCNQGDRRRQRREAPENSRAELWMFGLLLASAVTALALHTESALGFARRMPEIAAAIRQWLAPLV